MYKKMGCRLLGIFLMMFALHGLVAAQIQFEDATSSAGFTRKVETWGAAWGDLNGDSYPDLFVGNHRRLPSVYKNNKQGRFSNVVTVVDSSRTWLDTPLGDHHGSSWADIDNDGDQDLYVVTNACCDNQLMINQGGVFIDRSTALGLDDDTSGWSNAWFDYNNDGRLDSIYLNFDQSFIERQRSSGTFTTSSTPSLPGCERDNYAQFIDLDADGDLEMMCIKEGNFPQKAFEIGQSSFVDVSNIVPSTPWVNDSAVADFDGDLKTDIFMTRGKMRPTEALLVDSNRVEAWLDSGQEREKGFSFSSQGDISVTVNTRFSNMASHIFIGAFAVNPSSVSFSLDANNFDHRGIPRNRRAWGIYIGYDTNLQKWQVFMNPGSSLRTYITIDTTLPASSVVTTGQSPDELPAPSRLLVHGPSGLSADFSAGFGTPVNCISPGAGDFDNDMDVDLYLVCRGTVQNRSNILYENQGGGNFVEVANAGGAAGAVGRGLESAVGAGENVVIADYDVDGFLDLFVANGLGMQPLGLGGPHQMFRNKGNGNHWIELDFAGTSSNRDGIGAKIYATAGGVTQLREQNGGFHRWAQHHQRTHFGLGGNATVDLRIEWPSGTVDNHSGVSADKLYSAVENGMLEVILGSVDPVVNLSIADISVIESAGTAVFNVSLSEVSTQTITVNYATTSSGNATQGVDYTAVNGTLTFHPGETAKTISVPVLTDTLDEGSETFEVDLSNPVNASILDGTGIGTINDDGELSCGAPNYDPGSGQGMYLWQDCGTGEWSMRVVGGGSTTMVRYQGDLVSDQGFLNVMPFSLEGNDILDTVGNPNQIVYDLKTIKTGQDGFDFSYPAGSEVCLALNAPQGIELRLGAGMVSMPLPLPLDLNTLQSCALPTGNECGAPSIDPSVDQALYLWKDCITGGKWHLRSTAGGSSSVVRYDGLLSADQAFTSVDPVSVESSDVFDTTDPTSIDFLFKAIGAGQDGVDFSFPDTANVCLDLSSSPTGNVVLLGRDELSLNAPFDLVTQGGCQ